MIRFACPQCHKALQVEDNATGKKQKCPQCGGALAVPAGKQAAASALPKATPLADATPLTRTVAVQARKGPPQAAPRVAAGAAAAPPASDARGSGRSLVVAMSIGGVAVLIAAVAVTLLVAEHMLRPQPGAGPREGDVRQDARPATSPPTGAVGCPAAPATPPAGAAAPEVPAAAAPASTPAAPLGRVVASRPLGAGPQPAAVSAPATVPAFAPPAVGSSGIMDVLRQVDPVRDSARGTWTFVGTRLATPRSEVGVLRLPVTPPAEYRLTVVVERTSPLHPSTPVQTPPPSRGPRPPTFRGRPLPFQEKPQPLPEIPQPAPASDESLDIILSVDGHPAALVLDGWQRTASGLELIDGKDVEQNGTAFHGELLPRRHNATVICTVGPGSVDAMVDGRTILHWTGPSDRLSIEAALAAEIGNNLALVASSQFRILRIELMPLGRAASLADQPPAADVALGSTAPGVAPARAALPAVPSPKALQCVALIEHPLGSGSGFAVGKKLVVTNAHVVEGVFPDEMKVRFGLENSKPQPIARILHFDRLRDLCVFELKTEAGGLPVRGEYTFAAGDRVTLVGNPAAVGDILMRNAVNRGRLSSVVRIKEQDFYQIEASVNPGWSGGPVLDGEGRVVAIVAMKAKDPIVTEIRGAMGKLDEQFRARIGRTAYQVGLTYGIPASALGAILKDPALYDAQRQAEANDRCTAKTLADRLSFLAEICMFRIQVNVPKQVRIEAQNLARGRTPAGTRRGAAQRGAIMTFMSEFEASRLRALLDEDLKSRESKFRDRLDQRIDAIQQSESLPDIIKHDLRTLAVAVREGNKFAEHPANTYGAFSTKVRSLSRDFKDHLKRLAENLKEKES